MSGNGVIDVLLIDAEDGQPFGRSEMPSELLPESFAPATRLDLGDSRWEVVAAQPAERDAYLAAGQLVLTLRRLRTVDPQEIAYTLPTLCAELPPLTPPDGTQDDLVIHEDEWRQAELVERAQLAAVETELHEIRQIFEHHSASAGEGDTAIRVFDNLHLRQGPADPLTGALTRQRLLELLPSDRVFAGVALRDGQGRVADSFAAQVGPVAVYGRCAGDRVTVLGVTPAGRASTDEVPGLAAVMAEFDLLLVDWCSVRCEDARR
ncbi:hypothetical protein GCM10010441_03230 [Kitasatospora paracochleata]|uniref:Uncharacterized protein n=1 Tax=Kitasatospora paracochleata TaxID=58354 RepID=A0ABT1J485_9ACTN|nr:hypothetical protein [Kitasatospora paracochleata]MCP2311561.1 hypothetical protein [Kitasatospora paracochleata]